MVTSRVAFISKGAKNPNAAKVFLDYLLSKRGQNIIANQADLYSLRSDIEGEATVQGVQKAIGDRARERLADTPEQILKCEGEREDVAAPAVRARHRGEEQAERRARPKADQRDQASANNDNGRRPPRQRTSSFGNLVHVESPLSLNR